MAEKPKWRIVLCDIAGRELQVISQIASAKRWSFRLKNVWAFTFQAPADDPRLAGTAPDGHPYLKKLRRTIKCFRLEHGVYVPRFTGIVWQTHAVGGDSTSVAVSCFDVMKRLDRRRVLDVDGYDALVMFGAGGIKAADTAITDGAQIVKTLIDRTNEREGNCGISTSAALGAVFEDVPDKAVRWERKRVAPAALEIANTFDGFDFRFQPVDRTDGTLAVAEVRAKIGVIRPEVILAWDLPPATASRVEWMDDGDTVANDLWAIGGGENAAGQTVSNKESTPSQSAIGTYVDISLYSSITIQAFLDSLAQEELNFRAYGKETMAWVPLPPPKGPFPWDDFDLGDQVRGAASSSLMGGFFGEHRVWGFDVTSSDEDTEECAAILTSSQ